MEKNTGAEVLSIQDWLKHQKRIIQEIYGPKFFAFWSQALGFSSRITFLRYISGKRNLTKKQAQRIPEMMDFGAIQKLQFAEGQIPIEEKTYVQDDFFETPLNTIILNLCGLQLPMTKEMIEKAMTPVYSSRDVERSISCLVDLQLIAKLGENYFRIHQGSVTTYPGVKSKNSRKYFEQAAKMANQAWELPLSQREFHSFTFRMNSEDMPRLKDIVRKFREDLSSLSEPGKRDSVIQCSVSAFPIFSLHAPLDSDMSQSKKSKVDAGFPI